MGKENGRFSRIIDQKYPLQHWRNYVTCVKNNLHQMNLQKYTPEVN